MNLQEETWVSDGRKNAALPDEIKRQELRVLTEEAMGRLFAGMTFDPDPLWISPERAGMTA